MSEKNDESLKEDFEEDFEEDFVEEEDLEEEEEEFKIPTEPIKKDSSTEDLDEELKQIYLSSGIHIGTKILSGNLRKIHQNSDGNAPNDFIYRQTNYGLYVLNIRRTEERIRIASKWIAKFLGDSKAKGENLKIVVSSVRRYGKEPVKKFAEVLGPNVIAKDVRFIPGSLTNPNMEEYIRNVALVIIVDPHADKQALREAKIARIPVLSLIDTDDDLTNVDLAIPANNRGKKALGLVFFLIAREVLKELGEISSDEEFPYTKEEFESKITPIVRD
jgi:small subunit ribosomal protein S2